MRFSLATLYVTFFAVISIGVSKAHAESIFMITSYHQEYDWQNDYTEAFEENMDGHDVVIFEMDTKRLPKSEFQAKADEAWAQYLELQPDYVVLGDDNALKFLGPKLGETATPTIFLGINNNPRLYFDDKTIPTNISGVLERPLVNRSISHIKLIKPDVKKVLFLSDDGITSQNIMSREARSGKIGAVDVVYKFIGREQAWKDAVRDAEQDGYDAIIIGLYHTIENQDDENIPATQIMVWTSEHSPVPIFALWAFSIGEGKAIGGSVMDGHKMGADAADAVKEVMADKNPGIKISKIGVDLYSEKELERWGLELPSSIARSARLVD